MLDGKVVKTNGLEAPFAGFRPLAAVCGAVRWLGSSHGTIVRQSGLILCKTGSEK